MSPACELPRGCRHAPPAPLPPNRDAWAVFTRCGTQWDRAGQLGAPTGVPLERQELAARALGIEWSADLLDRLAVLEDEALTQQHRALQRQLARRQPGQR